MVEKRICDRYLLLVDAGVEWNQRKHYIYGVVFRFFVFWIVFFFTSASHYRLSILHIMMFFFINTCPNISLLK